MTLVLHISRNCEAEIGGIWPTGLHCIGAIPLITLRLTYLLFWSGSEAIHRLLGHLISLGVRFRLNALRTYCGNVNFV